MRLIIWAALLLVAIPTTQAAWREASSSSFVVYSDGGEEELRKFTERVEMFDQVLRIMTGLKEPRSPVKVRIYLVSDHKTVRELDGGHRPLAGFYTTRAGGGIAVVDRARATSKFATNGELVLYHEYSHHFMAQYFPSAYPVWYQEGFADYFAPTAFNRDGSIDVGQIEMTLLPELYNQPWLSTRELMTDTLEQLPTKDWGRFYAQGWLLTHYLFNNPARHAQFVQYLKLRAEGVAHPDALGKSFDLTDEQLGGELRAYFSTGKLKFTRLTSAAVKAPAVSLRELPGAEGDCLLLELRLELGLPKAEVSKELEAARSRAARFRDSEFAQRMVAEAEVRYGDRNRGRELLQSLVSSVPEDRHAILELARLELATPIDDDSARREADRRARTLAVKANRMAPDDPEALFLFYLSFAHESDGPSENAVQALSAAYQELPQYPPIAMEMARQELRAGNPDGAISVLKPIAYSPHNERSASQLRKWIQDIEEDKSTALGVGTADESADSQD